MFALWRLGRLVLQRVLNNVTPHFFKKQKYVIKADKLVLEQFKLTK